MANKKIIGLGYQIGVGKDSVAAVLHEYGFITIRFADALKEAVSTIFGWPRHLLEDQQFKATVDPFWEISPRTALQLVGTEAMRNNIRKDIWVKALQRRAIETSDSVVVTDVRFLNEVEAVKAWGGKVVRIVRPNNPLAQTGSVAKHASEIELEAYTDWDYILINNGNLDDLKREVQHMYRSLYPDDNSKCT